MLPFAYIFTKVRKLIRKKSRQNMGKDVHPFKMHVYVYVCYVQGDESSLRVCCIPASVNVPINDNTNP